MPRPPLLARWALKLFLRRDDRCTVQNDLRELYERRLTREGANAAAAWYRRQIMQYPFRLLADRFRRVFGGAPALMPRRALARESLQNIFKEFLYSARGLAKSPGLSVTIVLTVGLGIGGASAVFSAVHAVLLRPLPYPNATQLVRIYQDRPPNRFNLSVADYLAIDEQQTQFEDVAAYTIRTMTFNREDVAERIITNWVTPGFLPMLGITPLHGRLFTSADGIPGAEPTVAVSYEFWLQQLGGRQDAIGQPIRLNGTNFTVIGVLPPETGPLLRRRDVIGSLQLETPPRRGPFFYRVLGRLRSNTEVAGAETELRGISERIFPVWRASYPDSTVRWGIESLHGYIVGDVGSRLLTLLAAVGFVLLIASTNAANLLVARGTQRSRELAVRAALGASRKRLLQHLLSESVILGIGGVAVGLAITAVAVSLLSSIGADYIPRAAEIRLTGPVLWFTGGVAAGSTLLFGLLPSLQASRSNFEEALRASGRASTAALHSQRMRRFLIIMQFAVAVPLLIGAGLVLTSLARLQRVDPGVNTERLLTLSLSLPRSGYPSADEVTSFWDEFTERVGALPGVTAVGLGTHRPPSENPDANNFNLLDRPTPPDQAQPVVTWVIASREYFRTLGIPLIRGRMFEARDRPGAPDVALVDQSWAQRFYPDDDPIGKRFTNGGCDRPGCTVTTVVGIVGDVKYNGLDAAAEGTVYRAQSREPQRSSFVFVRTANDPLAVLPPIRAIVKEIDLTLPVSRIATMDELMSEALEAPRNFVALIVGFSLVALLLAAIGIYGVMSYFVQQHTRDIGIRMALGGGPTPVLRMVMQRGMRLVAVGIATGLAGALLLTRFMTTVLFEVEATDPLTFAGVTTGLLFAAFLACLVPARRATRVDPASMLREE